MSDVYVYAKDCEDFASFGLVGALTPISGTFKERANGASEIILKHPIDDLGRYTALVCGNQLKINVPVRTTPEIRDGNIVTAVEQWVVRDESVINIVHRGLFMYPEGLQHYAVLPGGTPVTVVQKTEEGRYKVKCQNCIGWMEPDGLEFKLEQTIADNSQSIESVLPAWTVKSQIFRIYSVQKSIDTITVSARHISYDLLYNLTNYKNDGEVSCIDALAAIMDNCISPHKFSAYTNLANVRAGIDWTRTNPIKALLDPEIGLTTLFGAALVRDNWEMYVLHDPGLNRGVTVEYGKNMTGIKYTESTDNIVTRVIPIGETEDGYQFTLNEVDPNVKPYVDSPYIDSYPVVYTQELICENCKLGDNYVDVPTAFNRMLEQAQAVFDAGHDLPQVEMTVDFVNLGDTAEYAQFKNLERLFLWDYVLVRHKLMDIDVTSRIVSIEWDFLMDRMNKMEVGAIGKTLANTGITSWQIPTGFSGSKIANQSVGNAVFKDNIIAARHMQADSINTDALQAGSVTANKIAAGAIDAQAIEAVTAKVGSLTASDITTDRLAAALAAFTVVSAGNADFDLASIKNLLANALILQEGIANSMQIVNLAITSANIMSATLGELVLKGEDGKYYHVFVGSDGTISTEEATVSEDEITAGQTTTGKQIVETTANIADLNAQTIKAQSAIIASIFTDALTAGKITAGQALISSATIPELYVTAIKAIENSMTFSANKTIQLIVGEQEKSRKWFVFDEDAMTVRKEGSKWSTETREDGFYVKHSEVPGGVVGAFHGDILEVRGLKVGNLTVHPSGTGGWVWVDK